MINDLEHLLSEKTILVATYEQTFPLLKIYKLLSDENIDNLHKRFELYHAVPKLTQSLFDRKVFDDMTKGNIVILFADHFAQAFSEFYALENHKFFISDNKYLPQFLCHIVVKNSIIRDLQMFL